MSKSVVKCMDRLISDAATRKEMGQLVLSGHHIINEYKGQIIDLFVSERYIQKHNEPTRPYKLLSEQAIGKITKEGRPEGILALIPRPHIHSDVSLEQKRTLVLWNLTDPRNIGSLARTALALHWTQLVIFGHADPFHPEAIRCSKGALLRFPRLVLTEDTNLLGNLSRHAKMYLAEKREQSQKGTRVEGNVALVLGSESHGLKDFPTSLRTTSSPISIPTSADMPFLSISAAGAILMHQLNPHIIA